MQQFPSQPLKPNFEHKETVREFYNLYTAMGLNNSRAGLITLQQFMRGFILFPIDLTPDQAEGAHIDPVKYGNLRLKAHFTQALQHPVNCICYAEYDNMIQINHARNVIADFAPSLMYASTIRAALNTQPLTTNVFRDVVSADRVPGRKKPTGSTSSTLNPTIIRENTGSQSNTLRNTPTTSIPMDYCQQKLSYTTSKRHRLKNLSYTQTSGDKDADKLVDYCIYHTLTRTTHLYSMNEFNNDLDVKDRIVYKLVHQLFKRKKE